MARGLAKAPEQRYPSCREFAAALAGALGLRPPPPALVRSPGPVSGPPNRGLPGDAERAGAAGPSSSCRRPSRPAAPAPASGGSGEPWLVRREPPRLRRVAIALAVIAVLAAATVAVVTTGVLRSPARKPVPPPKLASFPIAARSALPPQSGDVWVMYQRGAAAQAQLYGEIKGAARGYVARLYAQPFPFTARPVAVASVVLHPKGKLAPYAFPVTPALATRYYVSVFQAAPGGGRSPARPLPPSTSRRA